MQPETEKQPFVPKLESVLNICKHWDSIVVEFHPTNLVNCVEAVATETVADLINFTYPC